MELHYVVGRSHTKRRNHFLNTEVSMRSTREVEKMKCKKESTYDRHEIWRRRNTRRTLPTIFPHVNLTGK